MSRITRRSKLEMTVAGVENPESELEEEEWDIYGDRGGWFFITTNARNPEYSNLEEGWITHGPTVKVHGDALRSVCEEILGWFRTREGRQIEEAIDNLTGFVMHPEDCDTSIDISQDCSCGASDAIEQAYNAAARTVDVGIQQPVHRA